jgi:hypothetical protein
MKLVLHFKSKQTKKYVDCGMGENNAFAPLNQPARFQQPKNYCAWPRNLCSMPAFTKFEEKQFTTKIEQT